MPISECPISLPSTCSTPARPLPGVLARPLPRRKCHTRIAAALAPPLALDRTVGGGQVVSHRRWGGLRTRTHHSIVNVMGDQCQTGSTRIRTFEGRSSICSIEAGGSRSKDIGTTFYVRTGRVGCGWMARLQTLRTTRGGSCVKPSGVQTVTILMGGRTHSDSRCSFHIGNSSASLAQKAPGGRDRGPV